MPTMHTNTHGSFDQILHALLNLTHKFLPIALAGGLVFVAAASGESTEVASTTPATLQGTVVDTSDDPIPGAAVGLKASAGDHLTAVTKDDGSFALQDITPGAYQITVVAEGFEPWSDSVTIEPGQHTTLADIKLRIVAVQRAVTVTYSSHEIATQQLKAEEQQRILRFIPNTNVTYEPHAEPLTARMKFHLAYKSLTNPVFVARTAAWAGVQQARDNPSGWRQGAEGYEKRLGAGFVDATTGSLITNAILPSLLHQDPRYFYQGTGTKWSRARHAMLATFICKGDNGVWQPNYSQLGGDLIGYSLSTAYYPSSDRTAGHVFSTFGIDIGLHVVGSLAQEFIVDKFTSKHMH